MCFSDHLCPLQPQNGRPAVVCLVSCWVAPTPPTLEGRWLGLEGAAPGLRSTTDAHQLFFLLFLLFLQSSFTINPYLLFPPLHFLFRSIF